MEIGSSPTLKTPVRYVRGVGPKIAELLGKRDIQTVEDLFYFCPIRYEDRRLVTPIGAVREGEKASIIGRITGSKEHFYKASRRKVHTAVLDDGTGEIVLKWFRFRRPYMRTLCAKGNLLFVTGEVKRFGATLEIVHPDAFIMDDENDLAERRGVLPVYSEIEGLKQGTLRSIVREAFERHAPKIRSFVPSDAERSEALPDLAAAVKSLHFPDDGFLDNAARETYTRRLILEEFFLFQASLFLKGRELKRERGISFRTAGSMHKALRGSLPFELTPAQTRVLEEISRDMERAEPMNRLLQGDVGCGKTICAITAACIALDSGYQVAFLAPTEILAEQQYLTVHRTFDALGIQPILLRGNMGRAERGALLKGVETGAIRIVIGTHALLQEDVVFKNLGLAIVDEQHRFGVIQRKTIKEKGSSPDMLVMTATPIPRTLAMVVFGDLDVSIIDGMPAGRQRIVTKVFGEAAREKAYRLVEDELRSGRQAFFVYPLVDESDKMELLAATQMAAHLKESVFPDFRIGLLHGRMKAEEKEQIMLSFRRREIDVLVCTTVVEVGIDIPNASVMLVEHAERFGLSQLHQLRGRVGRGSHPSKCFLIAAAKQTGSASRRLRIMEETHDGFRVAEEDMKIRGPGDMLGVRQAGIPRFRIGDIVRNGDLMGRARAMAQRWVTTASSEEIARVREESTRRWGKNLELYEVL